MLTLADMLVGMHSSWFYSRKWGGKSSQQVSIPSRWQSGEREAKEQRRRVDSEGEVIDLPVKKRGRVISRR